MSLPSGPMTRERVENALNVLAGVIAQSSPEDVVKMAPIYERLERELEAMQNDVRSRALARLAACEAR